MTEIAPTPKVHSLKAKESATVPNLLWHRLRVRLLSGVMSVTVMDSGEMLQVRMGCSLSLKSYFYLFLYVYL